jgi:hypothetical protein
MLTKNQVVKDNVFEVMCDEQSLVSIAFFYCNETWPFNPYIAGNKLTLFEVEGSFKDQCAYLGLPAESFLDEEYEEQEVTYDKEEENDFYPYDPEPEPDFNYDDNSY